MKFYVAFLGSFHSLNTATQTLRYSRGTQRLFSRKITVRRSKYCLEISEARERLKQNVFG